MAVLLEAYLLGCGQAMLDGFVQQVQAVDALQEAAVMIKQASSEKRDLPPSGATLDSGRQVKSASKVAALPDLREGEGIRLLWLFF